MGKASRRKRPGADAVAIAAIRQRPVAETKVDALFARWDLGLAVVAGLFWFLGHVPGIGTDLAIPMWLVSGLALGLLAPWLGLLLGVVTIPFLGGAIDQPTGEVLRNLPIHGAAIRVVADRFLIGPMLGRRLREGPPAWVVVSAAIAALLYLVTVSTGAAALNNDPAFFASGIRWVIGGSAGMLSAWIAASHLVAGRERTLTNVVLLVVVVAAVVALLAYVSAAAVGTAGTVNSPLPGLNLFTFPGVVNGRLAALGYPTPTSMGLAVSLPFAAYAAWRLAAGLRERILAGGEAGSRRVLAALPYAIPLAVIALVLWVVALTNSRGPVIAIAGGTVVALLFGARVPRALLIPGGAIGITGVLYGLYTRYGTINPIPMIQSLNNTSDLDRMNTWIAGVQIALANPILGGGWRAIERFGDFSTRAVAYSHNTIFHGFAEGGLPLGISQAAALLYSGWMVIKRRRTMAPWLIAAAVTFFVCGAWDIPQVRTYASTMGGIALGMAAGPLIARGRDGGDEGVTEGRTAA